jgi:hypothetical protein
MFCARQTEWRLNVIKQGFGWTRSLLNFFGAEIQAISSAEIGFDPPWDDSRGQDRHSTDSETGIAATERLAKKWN